MREEIRGFEDLECWKEAVLLRRMVMEKLKAFPGEEKFRLVDQMIRCARSITNNIAEGYGRFHFAENAKFCRDSRGSLMELLDHSLIAFEEKYIGETELNTFRIQIEKVAKLLNGYISYLMNAKQSTRTKGTS